MRYYQVTPVSAASAESLWSVLNDGLKLRVESGG
jgi:hypothetical protein